MVMSCNTGLPHRFFLIISLLIKIKLKGKVLPIVGYDIKIYKTDFMPEVANLLAYLWGNNHSKNLSYFKWKYHDNPYTENPLGIVALHKGKVVGFRGYFATKWQIRKEDYKFTVLSPGDNCVHPAHRRKKLSVIMGETATNEFSSISSIFFNFSATKISEHINLINGFIPLMKKAYLNNNTIWGLIKFILKLRCREELDKGKISFGNFDDIVVSDRPNPKDMSTIIYGERSNVRKFTLLQNEEYFKWRFRNTMKKYAFYYYRQNNRTTGYVVIRVSENNKRGFISDFSSGDILALEKILKFIIKMKNFDILSVSNYSVTDNLSTIFKKLHFKKNSLTRLIEKSQHGEIPLFIRPVKQNYAEENCFIKGLDIRKVENWTLKEICSDAS
jgi:hypothetical protein